MAKRMEREALRREGEKSGGRRVCPGRHKGQSSVLQAMRKVIAGLIPLLSVLGTPAKCCSRGDSELRRSSVFLDSTIAPQFCAISALRVLLEPVDSAGQNSGVLAGCVMV